MKRRLLIPLWYLLCLSPLATDGQRPARPPIIPSPLNAGIINLIATPERYDGRMVTVVGFLAIESEDARLYLSREDYLHNIMENGIFIDANKEVTRDIESKDLHYVQITGIQAKGLATAFSRGAGDAGITDVRLCFPLPELTETRPRRLKDKSTEKKPE